MLVFDSSSTKPPNVWLYSPDGNCQKRLGLNNNSTNKLFDKCVMAAVNKEVLLCLLTSVSVCYRYDAVSNTLVEITGPGVQSYGGTFQLGKIVLITKLGNKMALDSATGLWSNDTIYNPGDSSTCYVSWKNVTFAFGSAGLALSKKDVNKLDRGARIRMKFGSFDMVDSGCATLPNGNILVAGCSLNSFCRKAYAEYNATNDTWSMVQYGAVDYSYSLILVIGKRVLILVTAEATIAVHEYFYENATMSSTPYNLPPGFQLLRKRAPCATVVPASWFSHVTGGCLGVN